MFISAATALQLCEQFRGLLMQPGIRENEALGMLGIQLGSQLHTLAVSADIQEIYKTLQSQTLDRMQVSVF